MAIPDWITLSTTSGGNGTTQVTVSVTDSNYIERIKTLRVTSSPDSLQADLEINQNNRYCRVFVYQPTISAWTEITDSSSQYGVVVVGEGESNVGGIKVLSNIPWHIEYEGGEEFSPTQTASTSTDVVTFSPSSGTGTGSEVTVYYSVPEYDKYSPWGRFSEYRIVSDNGEHTSGCIHFTQERYDSISASPSSMTFKHSIQINTFSINCHSDWSIVSYPSWLTLSQNSGFGNATVYATSQENTGVTRTGYIIAQLDYGVTGDTQHPNIVYINVTQYDVDTEYRNEYLTFQILSDGYISWGHYTGGTPSTIEYSKNGGAWTTIVASELDYPYTGGTKIYVQNGDNVRFRGDNDSYFTEYVCGTFSNSTAGFTLEGNIMSLINSTNFSGLTEFPSGSSHNFCAMFESCTGLTDASNLVLPATALAGLCYTFMFANCTSLTTAPQLPATTLANECYDRMFAACTSLTTIPELPATTLANDCYFDMFWNCTSLTTAPELPATTLAEYCYYQMFRGCTSLTTAPELPATTLANRCYEGMFESCTNLTTAPELPATTLAYGCYTGMFRNCTNLTTAPELSATTLVRYCYEAMFSGCYNLASAPELPATTLAPYCYQGMFYGCFGLTTAPELPATTLAYNCYNGMFRNCVSLNYIKCLATDISAEGCTYSWVSGVASNGTFVKNPNMSGWTRGASGIPTNWTVIDDGDEPTPSGYTDMYLTFRITSNGSISWKTSSSSANRTIVYSKNGGSWTSITSSTGGTQISVVSGDTVRFRGNNATYATEGCFSGTTAGFIAEGNIMSLINSSNFSGLTTLQSASTFDSMFKGCTGLTDASNLILPATVLTDYCYGSMFSGCTSLTTAPELPATTLANNCYMFMFRGCSGLTTAPELPATTLAIYCYGLMFDDCNSLNYIKCLATDISAYGCTNSWVNGVSSSGTFVKASNMSGWTTGVSGIPTLWTIQDA